MALKLLPTRRPRQEDAFFSLKCAYLQNSYRKRELYLASRAHDAQDYSWGHRNYRL